MKIQQVKWGVPRTFIAYDINGLVSSILAAIQTGSAKSLTVEDAKLGYSKRSDDSDDKDFHKEACKLLREHFTVIRLGRRVFILNGLSIITLHFKQHETQRDRTVV